MIENNFDGIKLSFPTIARVMKKINFKNAKIIQENRLTFKTNEEDSQYQIIS